MIKFPIVEAVWYEKRDHRTKLVDNLDGFDRYKVGIVIGWKNLNNFKTQLMTWLASNMLARWCRHIVVQIEGDVLSVLNGTKGKDFRLSLQSELFNIDPYLNLQFSTIDDSVNTLLTIGCEVPHLKDKSVWIDSDGWRAGIGAGQNPCRPSTNEDSNIIGSCFAACLGCAEIFRRAIGKDEMREKETWYSLYDFSKSTEISLTKNALFTDDIQLGHIHQVGCGAVGASLDYLLSLTDWKGDIDLIDFDSVDISNCNRSLPFLAWDTVNETKKVKICERILSTNRNISTRIFEKDYSEFIKEGYLFNPTPDLILCLANDRGIWSTIQHNYPPLVYHATTTPNWGINVGRHIPRAEWCILCRFHQELQKTYRFIPPCSTGTIVEQTEDTQPIEGVLPFLSSMSAILILSELAKTNIQDYPVNKAFIQFSAKTAGGAFLQSQTQIKEDCVCSSQHLSTYPASIRNTKYWKYTEPLPH